MAMASMATTLSASHSLASTAGLLSKPTATSRRSPALVVLAANSSQSKADLQSRRQVAVSLAGVTVSLAVLAVGLSSSSQRQEVARNIPIFGLRKAKKISEEVVQEVKELVKGGKGEVAAFKGAISGTALPSFPSGDGLSPELQAGVVGGAGLVGVLVASTVVNSLVSPAK